MTRFHRTGGFDRRSLLTTAGSALALVGLPRRALAAPVPVGPVMATLSAYMAAAGGRPLPDEVVEKAKHHILDTFAAMISGSSLELTRFRGRSADLPHRLSPCISSHRWPAREVDLILDGRGMG